MSFARTPASAQQCGLVVVAIDQSSGSLVTSVNCPGGEPTPTPIATPGSGDVPPVYFCEDVHLRNEVPAGATLGVGVGGEASTGIEIQDELGVWQRTCYRDGVVVSRGPERYGLPLNAGPSNEELARGARDRLLVQLRARVTAPTPVVSTSPPSYNDLLVGLRTWYWVDAGDFDDVSDSASDSGLTVRLTATPLAFRVDPGDGGVTGDEVVLDCEGPGLVWETGMADDQSQCAHIYQWSSRYSDTGAYDVVAETDWSFAWTASGPMAQYLPATSGDIGTTTVTGDPQPVTVIELQAVID